MRLLIASVFAFFLIGCAGNTGIPGVQSVGLEPDPDRPAKLLLVTAGIAVDGVGVYGRFPPCESKVKPCHDPKKYRDAKLVAQAIAGDMKLLASGKRSDLAMGLILMYAQWQLAKTIAGEPSPTDPESPPATSTIQTLDAIGAAGILVTTASERVRDAASVNSSVADLLADLDSRVAALP